MNNEEYLIGKVIKVLRNKQGFSQDQLATKTGLSKGLISQIENDKVIPSFSNLKKISLALQMELSRFFFYCETDSKHNCVVVSREEQDVYEERGLKIHEFSKGLESVCINPVLIELESGNETKVHRHEETEFIYLITGIIKLTVGSQSYELNAGDYAVVKGILQHKIENVSSSRVQIISIGLDEPGTDI